MTVRCQQCGKEFLAKRQSAKFCSSLCRQHNYRGKRPYDYTQPYHLLHKPDEKPQASKAFWYRVHETLNEARLVAQSTDGATVAASIIVKDDDAEIVREWELDGEP